MQQSVSYRKVPVKTLFLTFLILLIGFLKVSAQAINLDSLVSKFNAFQKNRLQEKVFVHTDKNFYVTGELLWFKVYTVESSTQKQTYLSKVAYVEIFNSEHKPLLQAKISLNEGLGNGSFYLPLSLNSGNYKLRAYTQWMKNFGPDSFFEKDITIVNTFKNLEKTPPLANQEYEIQFFPEGGNLVEGLESKIAFKIATQQGKGIEGQGFIVDQNNDTLVKFQPAKFGLGHFFFQPQANHTYKAIFQVTSGKIITSELPEVFAQGFVMKLEDTGTEELKITVRKNISADSEKLYLLIHNKQQVQMAQMQTWRDSKTEFTIKKANLGEGISHLTVFNEEKQPVSERLFFKRPQNKLQIQIKPGQESFSTRKKVNLELSATDLKENPQLAHLSLSVYLQDSLQEVNTADIHSYLHLTSELKGYIESPEYYLNQSNSETNQALDNLMLTHGWRRFRWEEVFQANTSAFEFLPEYTGHLITGIVTDTKSGKPAFNIPVYLSIPGKRLQFYTSRSDTSGHFKFNTKDFYGNNEVLVQTNTQIDSLVRIEMSNSFSPHFSSTGFAPFSLSGNLNQPLLIHSISMQVQNVFAEEKRNRFLTPRIDTTLFYFSPDKKYLLDDFTLFPTVEEVMREYVPEVAVRKRKGKLHFLVFDKPNDLFFEDDPLVLLDGIPVFDNQKMFSFDPLKIQQLELISGKYILGPLAFNGILNFSTYTHDLAGFEIDPATVILSYEGLQLQREFYSPVYESDEQLKSRLPDLRNVLYWEPTITTDVAGKKQLYFYTSDQPGTYIGVIHGISSNGLSGSQSFVFEVKRQL